jgi:hypothetical protein
MWWYDDNVLQSRSNETAHFGTVLVLWLKGCSHWGRYVLPRAGAANGARWREGGSVDLVGSRLGPLGRPAGREKRGLVPK